MWGLRTGGWCGTPKHDRTCYLCISGQVCDEYHYIFECMFFEEEHTKDIVKNLTSTHFLN